MNIIVNRSSIDPTKGHLQLGSYVYPCALGRSGVVSVKREGDGGTPIGRWYFRKVFYRADRTQKFPTLLPVQSISGDDGWCDDPEDRNYNRYVKLPYNGRTESLWREDELYDIAVVLSHNEVPRVRMGGSAIFMHVAKPGYPPTEGCIALKSAHLRTLLKWAGRHSFVEVNG